MKKFIIIFILAILSLFIIFLYENNKNLHVESKIINNKKIDKLSVSLPADVYVKKGDTFQVKYYSTDNSNFYINENSNEINVGKNKIKEHFFSKFLKAFKIGNNHFDKTEIIIPDNTDLKLVTISSKNGDINVDNSKLNKLRLNNENGDMTLNNLIVKELNIKNSNGDIDINNTNILTKGSVISSENGDINITNTNSKFNDTFISTLNGNVSLQNTKNIRKSEQ